MAKDVIFRFHWENARKLAFSALAAQRGQDPSKLARDILESWLGCFLTPEVRGQLGITEFAFSRPPLIEEAFQEFMPKRIADNWRQLEERIREGLTPLTQGEDPAKASRFAVVDEPSHARAGELLEGIKEVRKEIAEHYDPLVESDEAAIKGRLKDLVGELHPEHVAPGKQPVPVKSKK